MDEREEAKNVWPKEIKTEPTGDIFPTEAAAGSLDVVNVTSLADIFDTAFTSTADPASHPRYASGNGFLVTLLIFFFMISGSLRFRPFSQTKSPNRLKQIENRAKK